MIRPHDTHDKPKKGSSLEEFLKDFCEQVNTGIHDDLDKSQDYLANHELSDYLDDDGIDITAIEQNEDLTVHDVLELGIHFARVNTHREWHNAMEKLAKKHGVDKELKLAKSMNNHDKPGLHVITDINELPDEVKDLLGEVLKDITKKKRGKK